MNAIPEPALAVRCLAKRFGGVVAADGIDLDVWPTEIHAVIGPNGSGKTTLLRQIFGEVMPDTGTIQIQGCIVNQFSVSDRVRAGLGRSYQIISNFPELTVAENVSFGLRMRKGTEASPWFMAQRDRTTLVDAERLLDQVGLKGRAAVPASVLSHGELRQLELAIALSTEPSVLLLDEPLAGLGTGESRTMTTYIKSLRSEFAVLLVEHDLEAVFAVADRITVLDRGQVISTGPPEEIRSDPLVAAVYNGDNR